MSTNWIAYKNPPDIVHRSSYTSAIELTTESRYHFHQSKPCFYLTYIGCVTCFIVFKVFIVMCARVFLTILRKTVISLRTMLSNRTFDSKLKSQTVPKLFERVCGKWSLLLSIFWFQYSHLQNEKKNMYRRQAVIFNTKK